MRPHSSATRSRALDLYIDRAPRDQIEALGVNWKTVYRWAREAGLEFRRAHSEKTKALALRLYASKMPPDDVVVEVGATWNTIRAWARAAGLTPRQPDHSRRIRLFDEDVRALAVEMYEDGDHVGDIKAATGASGVSIRKWARAAGVKPRPRHRVPKIDGHDVIALRKKFGSYVAAAEILGCTPQGAAYAARRVEAHR